MDFRQPVFAAVAFFRTRGPARVEKVRSPWRGVFSLRLFFPGCGNRHLHLSLVPAVCGALLTEEALVPGPLPPAAHRQGLSRHLKGAVLTALETAAGGRGLRLRFSGARELEAVLVSGQLSLYAADGTQLWSAAPARPAARFTGPAVVPETPSGDHGQAAAADAFAAALFAGERMRAAAALRQQCKKIDHTLALVREDLARFAGADALQAKAELLKGQLFKVGRGAARVELEDWARPGETVPLELDARLSPQQNLERLFHRAGKYRRGLGQAREREAQLVAERESLAARLAALEALPPDDPQALVPFLPAERDKHIRAAQPAGAPWTIFPLGNFSVLLGKNSRGNEAVTFRLARGNDLWLHARNQPGAHVVIHARQRGAAVPEELVLRAAQLALWYSGGRAGGRDEVAVIPVKLVRKVPGGKAGEVTYGRGRTVLVTLEEGFRPGALFPESRDT